MPLNASNQRHFMRKLYAGQLQTVQLLKRGNDLKQGTVVSYTLFGVRMGQYTKTGEPIQDDETSNHRVTWHIPVAELERVGVKYLNAADRIVDKKCRYWQSESTTSIDVKLFETHVCLNCLRIDPPKANQQ